MGPEGSASHSALLDATEAVMREEGYAAVTSRRVAEKAGLKQQLVYYYFLTMDDLLLATFRRKTQRGLARLETALASEDPLRGLWQFLSDPAGAVLSMEFIALSNHNGLIRAEMTEHSEHIRRLQTEAVARALQDSTLAESCPPEVLTFIVHSTSQILGWEASLGMSEGHASTKAFFERLMADHDRSASARRKPAA
jgi:AcrR family transcriptional regulator